MEAVLSRGDRRLGKVIHTAWKLGARFDGWDEHFSFERWRRAFEENGLDPAFYANRKRDFSEVMPWDHIDIGVSKGFLVRNAKRPTKGFDP